MEKITSEFIIEATGLKAENPLIMGKKKPLYHYLFINVVTFFLMVCTTIIYFMLGITIGHFIIFELFQVSKIQSFRISFIAILGGYFLFFIFMIYFSDSVERYSETYIITDKKFVKTTDNIDTHEIDEKFSLNDLENVTFNGENVTLQFKNDKYSFKCPDNMEITEIQDKIYNIEKS